MQIRIRHKIHRNFVKINIEYTLKPCRTCKIWQEIGDNIVHLIIRFFPTSSYLTFRLHFLLGSFSLRCHLIYRIDDSHQGLVVDGQWTIRMFHQFIERKHAVVWGNIDIIVFDWRKDWCSETKNVREFIFQNGQNITTQAWTCAATNWVQHKEWL